MDVDGIETFVTIVQLGGFSRAAVALHRSQPALTRRVALLEDDVGTRLLERRYGGVDLTAAGVAFLPYAESVLAAIRDGHAAVRALQEKDRGTITLALVGMLASTPITARLRDFSRRHPGVQLLLRTANSREVGEMVARGAATVGLRYFPDPRPDITSKTVAQEELVVVCAPQHPIAARDVRDAQALAGQRWLAFEVRKDSPAESFARVLARQLTIAGLDGATILPIDSLTAQKRLVEAGFGVALLPRSTIDEELRIGTLRILDVPQLRTSVPVTVVYRRKGYLGPAVKSLLAVLSSPPLKPSAGTSARIERRWPARTRTRT